MEDFQCALKDCRLHDVGFKGPKYTWNNGRPRREYTLEMLDRVVGKMEWSDIWGDASVDVLVCYSLDHLPLLLTMNKSGTSVGKKWRPFHFETGWSECGDFQKFIQESWVERIPNRYPWTIFRRKIHKCQRVIKQCS